MRPRESLQMEPQNFPIVSTTPRSLLRLILQEAQWAGVPGYPLKPRGGIFSGFFRGTVVLSTQRPKPPRPERSTVPSGIHWTDAQSPVLDWTLLYDLWYHLAESLGSLRRRGGEKDYLISHALFALYGPI